MKQLAPITDIRLIRRGSGASGPVFSSEYNEGKLHLKLRSGLSFTAELERMQLPNDVEGLIRSLNQAREDQRCALYNCVFVFCKLKARKGSFWEDYNDPTGSKFKSLDHFLAALDLPNGATLAGWEVLVRFFDKETFVQVGPDTLGYMCSQISSYQKNTDQRKIDYQKIFDAYSAKYSVYTRAYFMDTVNRYVNKTYALRLMKQKEAKYFDPDTRPVKRQPVGTHRKRVVVEVKERQILKPAVENDFEIEEAQCGGCSLRDAEIKKLSKRIGVLVDYALALEAVLAKKVGKDKLEEILSISRPDFLP